MNTDDLVTGCFSCDLQVAADPSSRDDVELGGLVRRLGVALEQVTGCVKTYLMQFSEAEGFSHLHLHLVPRQPDQPEDARGSRVFTYLTDDEERRLPESQRDSVALALRETLAQDPAHAG